MAFDVVIDIGYKYCLLKCGTAGNVVAIPLLQDSEDKTNEYFRTQGRYSKLISKPADDISIVKISVRASHERQEGHEQQEILGNTTTVSDFGVM